MADEDEKKHGRRKYEPTAEQIAESCEEIQGEWTEIERRHRVVGPSYLRRVVPRAADPGTG